MNQPKDFTENSEWITPSGIRVKFHHFCRHDGNPMFTTNQETNFEKRLSGAFGFVNIWKRFKRINND